MDVLYIDSQRFGYDYVKISDNQKVVYQGRCGTIPLKSEDEYIEVEIRNQNYEREKENKDQFKRLLHLLSMIVVGLFHGYETQGLGRPYYFKIKVRRQLFMQLHYDDVFTHYFTSNVDIIQQRIKDKDYILFWIFSYILPLQIITIILIVSALLTLKTVIVAILIGIIAVVSQLHILYRLYEELK